jgi:hypothetical protein
MPQLVTLSADKDQFALLALGLIVLLLAVIAVGVFRR